MSSETSNKVLIVGAGLGGLVLAQILHANNVPFEIFERDQAPSSRKQGWAVALVESLPGLEELLPEETAKDLYTNSVNVHSGENDEIGFVDAITGQRVGNLGNVPHGHPDYILRVSREKLRNYLWTKNKLPVSSGKQFTHYEEDEQGVTVFFKDGTSARGSLLIGGDGAHSHVRDQLMSGTPHQPVLSRWVPIVGEVTLEPALYEPIRKLSTAVVLSGAPGVRQQLGMLDIEPNKSKAYYFWALMLTRDNYKEFSDWVATAGQQELYDLAVESTKHLAAPMKDLIVAGGADALVQPQLKFVEFYLPQNMPTGRVTLLGDAAHTMIPFRGAGANTAILDACDLARLLIKSHGDSKDAASVVPAYHAIMIPRGKENVLSSRAAGEDEGNPAEDWARVFQRHH